MPGNVLIAKEEKRGPRLGEVPTPELGWRLAMVGGAALALVGWTDAFLLWFPANFGNKEWEFATTSTFFDAVPLGTIGLLALAAAALNRGGRGLLIGLGIVFPLLTLFLMGTAGLFALAGIEAWGTVAPPYKAILERVVVKTSILSVTYVGLYSWLGWTTAFSARKPR